MTGWLFHIRRGALGLAAGALLLAAGGVHRRDVLPVAFVPFTRP